MSFDEIKTLLNEGVCNVTFTKVDGTQRVMRCTTKDSLIPNEKLPKSTDETKLRKQSTEAIAAWDLDKGDWRSFRLDKLINLEKVA